jgi:hypothetical protein
MHGVGRICFCSPYRAGPIDLSEKLINLSSVPLMDSVHDFGLKVITVIMFIVEAE